MLRSSAALATGGVVGAATISRIASEPAQAADTDLTVEGDSVTVRGDAIAAVPLSLSVGWAYEVPASEEPAELTLDVLAGRSQDDLTVVASETTDQLFLSNSGEESFEVDLLGEGVVEAETMLPAERGATTATDVVVGVELRLTDPSGLVIAADSETTTTTTLEVTKDPYDPTDHGNVTGAGSVTIELA